MPRMARPFEMTSSVVTCLASSVVEHAVLGDTWVRVVGHVETEESSHVQDNSGPPSTIPSDVNRKALALVALMFALLVYGTVLVFLTFDRSSNSASDTIRPFLITMAPVWIVAIAAARVLVRRS